MKAGSLQPDDVLGPLRESMRSPSSGEVCLEVCSWHCSLCLHLFFSIVNLRFEISRCRNLKFESCQSCKANSLGISTTVVFNRISGLDLNMMVVITTLVRGPVAQRNQSATLRRSRSHVQIVPGPPINKSYGVAELGRRESLKLVYVGSNPTSVAKLANP